MQTLDQSRIEAFAGQIATEIGAALNAALVTVGDQLGLYRAMADAQSVTAGELAARTNTHERYVREWLNAQAAGGFVTYDGDEDSYTLPAEHALILADETSPVAMAGIFQAATAVTQAPRLAVSVVSTQTDPRPARSEHAPHRHSCEHATRLHTRSAIRSSARASRS